MNKEYLKEVFEANREKLKDCEYEVNSPEELELQIKSIINSNLEYDYNISLDMDKLFISNTELKKEKEEIEVEIDK